METDSSALALKGIQLERGGERRRERERILSLEKHILHNKKKLSKKTPGDVHQNAKQI